MELSDGAATSWALCFIFSLLYLVVPKLPLQSLVVFPWPNLREEEEENDEGKKKKSVDKIEDHVMDCVPLFSTMKGRPKVRSSRIDPFDISVYIPENVVIDDRKKPTVAKLPQKVGRNSTDRVKQNRSSERDIGAVQTSGVEVVPKPSEPVDEEGCLLSALPRMDKCTPDCPEFQDLKRRVPGQSIGTYVRFLVARKGNVDASEDLLKKHLEWREQNLPISKLPKEKRDAVVRALGTGICIPYGKAKDGTPVMVFRGAFYNAKLATPDDYALAFAYAIEETIKGSGQCSITVLANARAQEGATNAKADIGFVKKLVSTLSNNFPERLKKTILFPMPWYARVMKAAVSPFVDPRSLAKITFSGHDADDRDPEVLKAIDLDQIPEVIGGTCDKPLISMADRVRATFKDD